LRHPRHEAKWYLKTGAIKMPMCDICAQEAHEKGWGVQPVYGYAQRQMLFAQLMDEDKKKRKKEAAPPPQIIITGGLWPSGKKEDGRSDK
jgi:hypothetical protein